MSVNQMGVRIPEVSASGFPAEFSAEHDLATAFAGFLCQMHVELGGDESAVEHLRRAAFLASRVLNEGHSCVDLSVFAGQPDPYGYAETQAPALADWFAQLRSSPVVAVEGEEALRPLVLDRAGRLYLYRYRAYERQVASRLRELDVESPIAEPPELAPLLNLLFPKAESADRQKAAAATALKRKLVVISGGPGTGKTTTVVKILAILLSFAPHLRIALAAPTGKAAMRMQESIRGQLDQLAVAAEVKSRLPSTSFTLHRLLGYRPHKVEFRHRRDKPLAYDIVVVDEASMLDLALAAKLLDALRAEARLILLGDKDQLASVETGVVFGAICASALSQPQATGGAGGALGDAVVLLEDSYRFSGESGIARFARLVNAGDADGALMLLHAREAADLTWWTYPKGALADELLKGFAGYLEAASAQRSAEEVLTELERYRVLCAVREGEFGAAHLNAVIGERFRKRLGDSATSARWYAGRPVLVTRNDYALRLFNGDVGVTLPDASGNLLVHFPKIEGGTRSIAPSRLPDCESAFAMTVHKAQGSEFDRVDLVLPIHESRVLTRQLLYTAVTRAKSGVRLWGAEEMVRASIARAASRYSGLTDLLG